MSGLEVITLAAQMEGTENFIKNYNQSALFTSVKEPGGKTLKEVTTGEG